MANTQLRFSDFVHDMEAHITDKLSDQSQAAQILPVVGDGAVADDSGEAQNQREQEVKQSFRQHETLPIPDADNILIKAPPSTCASEEKPSFQDDGPLLQKVLAALKAQPMVKWRRRFLKDGDVVVVTDRNDLSISCRVRSDDLRRSTGASFLLEPEAGQGTVDGVSYLCVLESVDGDGMPRLAARKLSAVLDGSGSLYSPIGNESTEVKREASSEGEHIDWVRAYESFFRMISHVEPKHQLINSKGMHDAVTHIEAISRIAAVEKANTQRSAITTAVKVLFAESHDLWAAVAKEPVRWLRIGQNLQHELVFGEAVIHLVGLYPSLSTDHSDNVLEGANLATVRRLATQKHFHRLSIDQELLLLTVEVRRTNLSYLLTHYVLDWVRDHLRAHRGQTGKPLTLCSHDNGECSQPAGFYRLLHKGGDSYLADTELFESLGNFLGTKLSPEQRDSTRDNLKLLKVKISSIVEPLLKSTLQYEKRAELPYLTNVSLEEEDIPWLARATLADADEGTSAGSDSDEDMED